jgi:hypothetical protein
MYNKLQQIITTSITNLDLHDISRAARTYGIEGFFIVHPHPQQQSLIKDIIHYWTEGYGGQYNPDRLEALQLMQLVSSLEEATAAITDVHKQKPLCVATDARIYPNTISYRQLKERLFQGEEVFLLLFGTGWGMEAELVNSCDYRLEPIEGDRAYNHLSVRSAVAIILDRLLGEKWYEA